MAPVCPNRAIAAVSTRWTSLPSIATARARGDDLGTELDRIEHGGFVALTPLGARLRRKPRRIERHVRLEQLPVHNRLLVFRERGRGEETAAARCGIDVAAAFDVRDQRGDLLGDFALCVAHAAHRLGARVPGGVLRGFLPGISEREISERDEHDVMRLDLMPVEPVVPVEHPRLVHIAVILEGNRDHGLVAALHQDAQIVRHDQLGALLRREPRVRTVGHREHVGARGAAKELRGELLPGVAFFDDAVPNRGDLEAHAFDDGRAAFDGEEIRIDEELLVLDLAVIFFGD